VTSSCAVLEAAMWVKSMNLIETYDRKSK